MNSQNVPQIWDVEQISESSLSPVSTKIFGTFQILDVQTHSQALSSETESHIDIGFGNDQSRFAGVHRFSVLRNFEGAESQNHVILKFSCQVATGSKPNLVASILQYTGFLHGIYAELLFRESVAEVEKWLYSQD